MKDNDTKFLAETYDQVTANTSNFESKIKNLAHDNFYVIGLTSEGKKYAVIEEYDKYDDGDRWIEEVNHYYQVEGDEKGKYISDQLAKELKTKAIKEHPELNKHISKEVIDWYIS